ncbi:hypothetical protein RBH76_14065 [Oscillospiraceae bacterium MB24-C1]|nr:hypothetical protein RBH76_14065 [Oscillospiraceae bacterium MB24-C1]
MNRLYKEHHAEQHQKAAIQDTMIQPTVSVVHRAPTSSENIDAPASPDELRRARAHRLIQVGAIYDQYMGTRDMTPDQVITLMSRISKLDNVQEIINLPIFISGQIT